MDRSLQEIRFLLLSVWVAGLVWVVVQGLTDVAPPWVCVLLAALACVLGQVAIGLNRAEPEDATTWQIENTTQRYMYWLLVLVFLAFAAKPYFVIPGVAVVGGAMDDKPVVTKPETVEPTARWACMPNEKTSSKNELICKQDSAHAQPEATGPSPDPWDKMDKYASVFGLGLTSIGLLMAVLTGWVIVLAFDFRGQLKELQAASNVDGKLAAALRATEFLSVKTHLHAQQIDFVVGSADHNLLTFAIRGLRMADEGLSMTADLSDIVGRLKHVADALRNGAPNADPRTRQACREYMPIVLVQLLSDSLQTGSHLRGSEGAAYRDAIRKLLHTAKAL